MTIPLVVLTYTAAIFLTAFEAIVLWQIATNKISLRLLIADSHGDASLSRLQFLIFTFVFASGILYLTLKNAAFPAIDEGVLMLLGISGATYALGKTLDGSGGVAASKDGKKT